MFSCGFSSIELHHPKLASSSEGFALEETIRSLNAEAELDLLVMADGQRLGFEIKYTASPRITRSMRVAIDTLSLDRLFAVHPAIGGSDSQTRSRRSVSPTCFRQRTRKPQRSRRVERRRPFHHLDAKIGTAPPDTPPQSGISPTSHKESTPFSDQAPDLAL